MCCQTQICETTRCDTQELATCRHALQMRDGTKAQSSYPTSCIKADHQKHDATYSTQSPHSAIPKNHATLSRTAATPLNYATQPCDTICYHPIKQMCHINAPHNIANAQISCNSMTTTHRPTSNNIARLLHRFVYATASWSSPGQCCPDLQKKRSFLHCNFFVFLVLTEPSKPTPYSPN